MNVLISTTPVFHKDKSVQGYELIYNLNTNLNEPLAESEAITVILNAFHTIGIDKLSGGLPAYIKFDENQIIKEIDFVFATKEIYIECLNPITLSTETISKFKRLKENGFIIVLGDYAMNPEYSELASFAKYIKVDFSNPDNKDKHSFVRILGKQGMTFIAYNIQTYADFHLANDFEYNLFQGFFFCQPEVLSIKDISPMKFNYMELMSKVNQPDVNFDAIAAVISRDLSLSFKLLKLVNSVAFGMRNKIESIKNALIAMGAIGIKKWVSLIAIGGMGSDTPDEVVRFSILRGKLCELLGQSTQFKNRSQDFFMVGLFSMLDVLMNRPMDELLEDIPFPLDMKFALTKKRGVFGDVLSLVLAYEKGEWEQIDELLEKTGIPKDILQTAYVDSIEWCKSFESNK